MGITAVNAADPNYAVMGTAQSVNSEDVSKDNADPNLCTIVSTTEAPNAAANMNETKGNNLGQGQKNGKNAQKISKENLDSLTITLNKFLESLNADIHFELHDKTKELIVQVVDNSTHQVLKEFPPHQLLDTIAAIRERIGVLLDKRV